MVIYKKVREYNKKSNVLIECKILMGYHLGNVELTHALDTISILTFTTTSISFSLTLLGLLQPHLPIFSH